MKQFGVVAGVLFAITATFSYVRFGGVEPCSILGHQLKSKFLHPVLEHPPADSWELADQSLEFALVGPMIDYMVDSFTPLQCSSRLYEMATLDDPGIYHRVKTLVARIERAPAAGIAQTMTPKARSDKTDGAPSGAWERRIETSPIDDSLNVFLSLDASEPLQSRLIDNVTPTLNLRCKKNQTAVYMNLKMMSDISIDMAGKQYADATLRYDQRPALKEKFDLSVSGESVFSRKPVEMAEQMMKHRKLLVEFTPFNSSPQVATFDLAGLSDSIVPLRKACHW
ncbi:MAG: type VI secretion protein [Gammaproteobacteria bacterium]|nr:type VI secretion protein [Gammaproteobacteria bacterium]